MTNEPTRECEPSPDPAGENACSEVRPPQPSDWQLLEYDKLKEEQAARIAARVDLVNYSLAAIGAVMVIASTVKSAEVAYLATPWISTIFGWNYLQQTDKIQAISQYIIESYPTWFTWETTSKHVRLPRGFHKVITLGFELLTFAAPALLAPAAWFASTGDAPWPLVVLALTECGLGLLLGVAMIASSPATARGALRHRRPLRVNR